MKKIQGRQITNTNNSEQNDLIDTLSELFDEHQSIFELYQWPFERLRWDELVFSILQAFSSEAIAAVVINVLSELEIIEVEKIAKLAYKSTNRRNTRRAQLVLSILNEAGFDRRSAEKALTTMVEAAQVVQSAFDGKVQLLLRRESETMLRNVMAFFSFSELDKNSSRQAITTWLQNVLNLPLHRETSSTKAFYKQMGISQEELITTSDDLDINLAIVDELIQQWHDAEVNDTNLFK
jgi:hypothetical protein